MHTTISPASSTAAQQRPRRARAAALGLAALAALGLSLGASAPALAHDELIERDIVADAQDGSVDAVRLTFSNSIIEVGTEIVVTAADGSDVTDGDPEISGPDVLQPLTPELPGGDYDVAWRVVSSDGHPIEGAFVLQLGAPGAAQAEDSAIVEADERGGQPERADAEAAADAASEGDSGSGGAGVAIAIGVGGALVILAVLIAMNRKRRARDAGAGPGGSDADSAEHGDEEAAR